MSPDRMRWFAVASLVAAVMVLVDQGTKAAALRKLHTGERIPLLGDVLGLQLAFNPGAILSLGAGFTGVITLLSVAAVALLIAAALRAHCAWWAAGIGFILGGAIGNLIDRLFSPPGFGVGHVTDFLAYGTLFIGNLADVALGIGVILLLCITWSRRRKVDLAPSTRVEAGAA